MLCEESWTTERVAARLTAKYMLLNVVTLSYFKEVRKMFMLPAASNLSWRYFITQISPQDFVNGKAIKNMHHKLLIFLSGQFKGTKLEWPTVDKESYLIMSGFRRRSGCFMCGWPFLVTIEI